MVHQVQTQVMETLKKLALVTVTTIAAVLIIAWSLDAFGFRSPMAALLLNWLVMSWIAIVGQVVHFALPDSYYSIRPFEQTGQIYERVGIRLFKALVRRGPLTVFSPTLKFPKEKTIPALGNLEREMRNAETGHVLIFVLVFLFVGYAALNGWLDAVVWILLFNLIINGYPIMLQRYNRIKLQELIDQPAR